MAYDQGSLAAGTYDTAPSNRLPGTLPGLAARIEAICKKMQGLRNSVEDIREKIDGTRSPGEAKASPQVAPVRTGFISQTDDCLSEIDRALSAACESLEHVWSKIS